MFKVWLISILVVGGAVGAILWATGDPAPGKGPAQAGPPAAAPLAEKELQVYKVIRREEEAILRAAAAAASRRETVDVQSKMTALLRGWHMTLQDWARTRQRVEAVIEVIRWENAAPAREKAMAEKIEKQRAMIARADSEGLKKKLGEQLDALQKQLDQEAPPIHEESRRLAKKHWAELDQLAARTQAPSLRTK